MMTEKVITSLEQVTPEWLTGVLSNSAALTQGVVASFDVDTGSGNWSESARLNVRYADGSGGTLPKRLFLKMVNADLGDEFFGPSEVTYYTRDYIDVSDAPLIQCYGAAYSGDLRRYHLLLDDVSGTHITADQMEPTLAYGLALAEGLAAMHARWWGAQRLAEAEAPIHSPEHIRRFVDIAEPGTSHILDRFATELEPHWPGLIHALFAKHPSAVIERTKNPNGFTLIHGDVGEYNIMVPREGERPLYIIDRQPFDWSLTTWLGVYDLAYAIVLDWEVEARRRLEVPILKHYHQQLNQRGVIGYSWERLFDDYRLSVPIGVYIATEYCRGGINERSFPYWMRMLQRSLTAIDDLDCRELWQQIH